MPSAAFLWRIAGPWPTSPWPSRRRQGKIGWLSVGRTRPTDGYDRINGHDEQSRVRRPQLLEVALQQQWLAHHLYLLQKPMSSVRHSMTNSASETDQGRVVHIITSLANGGAQRHVLRLCAALGQRRRFATTLLYGPGGPLDDHLGKLRSSGVRAIAVPDLRRPVHPYRDLRAALRLAAAIQRQRSTGAPLVVHTHSTKAGMLGRFAAALVGADAVVHTFHGFGFLGGQSPLGRRVLRGLEGLPRRLTDWSVCVCAADRQRGIELRLLDQATSSLIYAGADLQPFRQPDPVAVATMANELQQRGLAKGSPLLATVACLKPQKAPLQVLEACRLVLQQYPAAHLAWIGDGELRPAVEKAIDGDEHLAGRVHLLGWRREAEVAAMLGLARAFVLLSHWEGLPLALLEARAAGVPCVATAICGNPEAIRDGQDGFLVPVDQPAAAAQRILELLTDDDLHQRMSQAARRDLEGFAADRVEPAHDALYQRLLRAPG